ncbi:hypothetical protein HDE74_004592 [Janthinobacterium sp. K2Li3]|nr:hypothetical protein [Janthinobacterium sp. K2C7]MBB5383817.1 hypothetical protein [Janthinobacterium sp. K2Li3]MBB5388322.1 hypothetical protein [Janthinobacterium sp. K2E3]
MLSLICLKTTTFIIKIETILHYENHFHLPIFNLFIGGNKRNHRWRNIILIGN